MIVIFLFMHSGVHQLPCTKRGEDVGDRSPCTQHGRRLQDLRRSVSGSQGFVLYILCAALAKHGVKHRVKSVNPMPGRKGEGVVGHRSGVPTTRGGGFPGTEISALFGFLTSLFRIADVESLCHCNTSSSRHSKSAAKQNYQKCWQAYYFS